MQRCEAYSITATASGRQFLAFSLLAVVAYPFAAISMREKGRSLTKQAGEGSVAGCLTAMGVARLRFPHRLKYTHRLSRVRAGARRPLRLAHDYESFHNVWKAG